MFNYADRKRKELPYTDIKEEEENFLAEKVFPGMWTNNQVYSLTDWFLKVFCFN